MGGIEQKLEKVENLLNRGNFNDANKIILNLLKEDEIPDNFYNKFVDILNLISEKRIDFDTKLNIFSKSFKFLKKKERKKIRLKVISYFRSEASNFIENHMKIIEEFNDFKLSFRIQKLLDSKLVEEMEFKILKDNDNFDKIIEKLNGLISKIHIQSLKSSVRYKIIDCYIGKGKRIIANLITLTEIDEVSKEFEYLSETISNLDSYSAPKESYDFANTLLSTGKSYYLLLEGKKLMEQKNYELAYEKFINIKSQRDLFQIENLEDRCIKEIGKFYEDQKKYDKALEYYKKNKKFEVDEIRIEIILYFDEANALLEKKEYQLAIKSFVKMYEAKKKLSNTHIIENIFTSCVDKFLSALSSYSKCIWDENDKSKLLGYEEKIKDIYYNIDDHLMKQNIFEILNFINDIKNIPKDKILKEKIMNENIINSQLPEILQRIYIEILLSLIYSTNDKQEMIKILIIIIKYTEEDLYISKGDLIKLRTLFSLDKSEENKKIFVVISKLYYILSKKGIEFEKNILIIIGNAIISTNKEKKANPNTYTEEEYSEIMINLFLSLEKLIKEQDYKLDNVEKIYNLVLESEIKNTKLLDILLNGYYYFYQNNLVFSNQTINNLLNILLEKEKNDKLLEIILSTFKKTKELYQKYLPKFLSLINKYPDKHLVILNIINSININDKILNDQVFHKVIDQYLNTNNYDDSIFLIIKKISISNRSSKMLEKYSLYEDQKKNKKIGINSISDLNQEFSKRDIRLKEYQNLLECGVSFDLKQLKDIENNLNLNDYYDLLIALLEKQNNLIGEVNLNLISNYFNKKNYKLFKIISDKKIVWKEKPLSSIIRGFGKNDEEEKKIIIKFLETINNYQELPKIIEKNYNFEKNFNKYENIDYLEKEKLIELLNNFKEIRYFSNKYYITINKLILSFINNENNKIQEKNEIYKIIIELLKSTSLNVSVDILKLCTNNIPLNEFIQNYSKILSNMKIKSFLKLAIFDKINQILMNNEEDIKLNIIKQMKYFIDWEILPSSSIKILNDNLIINSDENYSEMSKEIIYIFGIICSNNIDNTIPKEFLEKIQKTKLYNLIMNQLPKLKINYIIYILSLIVYYGQNNVEEKNYYSFPREFLVKKIKEKIDVDTDKEIFEESLKYFEIFHKFNVFSPKRDKYIRKLFFNKDLNINKISQILVMKSTKEEYRIEKIEGQIINGKIYGFGLMYYTNGDYYNGYFWNNIKEGEGQFFENDNPIGVKQIWREGKLIEV